MLSIKTLGQFNILLNGISVTDGKDAKRGLFLTYLAERRTPLTRLQIAQLLWPGVDDATAQVNLRSLLLRLRREGMEPFLDITRHAVQLISWDAIEYDVASMRTLTTKVREATMTDLVAAADLYKGPFLQTVNLDGYSHLDEWATTVRTEMELRAVQALSLLVHEAISTGYAEMVLHHAEHLVTLTPYEDESQALYIQVLFAVGRVSEGLRHFNQYQRRLQEDMQLQVGSRLTALMAELSRPRPLADLSAPHPPQERDFHLDRTADAEVAVSVHEETNRGHYFPFIEHPIIGRTQETERLLAKLDSGSRLVTVMGIGGTGKTFFVRSLYEHLHNRFNREVYYVDLRSDIIPNDQAADALMLAIAAAINITPQPGRPIFDQVIEKLVGLKRCIVLDNFETLQPAAPRIQDLLHTAPHLTILVTSRERLGLQSESVLLMGGLGHQAEGNEASPITVSAEPFQGVDTNQVDSDAIRYFLQCLHRHDLRYEMDAEKLYWIQRVCHAVEALPLAIELAAMQVPFFSLPELAANITKDQSLLSGMVGDLPGDHYSVWAVLDSMWQTLDEEKRRVLTELSAFAGPFHREAMLKVAPAERSVYMGLINASLLRLEEPAWFSLHPLVRQYAERRLAANAAAHERHAQHFLSWFTQQEFEQEATTNNLPPLAIRCRADILQAWQWAATYSAWELLDGSVRKFARYLYLTLQQSENIRLLSIVLEGLPTIEERSQLQHRLAGNTAANLAICMDLLTSTESIDWIEHSIAWLEAAGEQWNTVAASLGYVNMMLGAGVGSLDRVASVLANTEALIEAHHLDALRHSYKLVLGSFQVRKGEWHKAYKTQWTLINDLPSLVDTSIVTVQLWNIACLDDWDHLARFIDRIELENAGSPATEWMTQWTRHYRSCLLAQQGDLAGAIAERVAIMDGYASMSLSSMLPIAYGDLTLWYLWNGDIAQAAQSAAELSALIREDVNDLTSALGQLAVAAFHYLSHDTVRSRQLLFDVLARGKNSAHPVLIFSSLYFLAQIHKHELSADLVQRILKIGAVSPAIHFVFRPMARAYLAEEGIEIGDEEREVLWLTDMAVVVALQDEVMKGIERSA